MHRRDFVTLLGASAAAWPLAARAQQVGKVARIGFLGTHTASAFTTLVEAFQLGLRDLGYMEGANIITEYRWADGYYERLPQLATELVRSKVDLIVTYATPGSLAAKQATATIPIVMAIVGDPVASGLVTSIARPGGNITGQSFFHPELMAKRVELLKEVVPQTRRMAVLLNPDNPTYVGPVLQSMEMAAKYLKLELKQFLVRAPAEIESAFERMRNEGIDAVAIDDDPILVSNSRAIASAAAKYRLLTIGPKETAQVGGLIGYGVDFVAAFRKSSVFVDKILKGTRPADIPIEQATRFQFVLNLATAKALNLIVPTATLLRADEVVE